MMMNKEIEDSINQAMSLLAARGHNFFICSLPDATFSPMNSCQEIMAALFKTIIVMCNDSQFRYMCSN